MIKIEVLKNYKDYRTNSIYVVNENEAHSLIDGGFAKLYQNKMMVSTDKKLKKK